MQAADRGMRVPSAVGPVLLENPRETVSVIGEVFEANRAILEKRDRLPVPFHRHHDVEALRADLPDRLLEAGIGRLDDGVWKAKIPRQLDQCPEASQIVG